MFGRFPFVGDDRVKKLGNSVTRLVVKSAFLPSHMRVLYRRVSSYFFSSFIGRRVCVSRTLNSLKDEA